MAVAYLDIKAYSRKSGPQAHGKAAYDAADSLIAPDGTKRDFTRKTGVIYSQLFCDSPAITRQTFWDAVEASEKRRDACTARGYEAALPIELTQTQNVELAKTFALYLKEKFGLSGLDLAVHYPTKRRKTANSAYENPHLHLLHPDRDKTGKKLNFSRNRPLILDLRKAWETHVNAALEKAGLATRIDMRSLEEQTAALDREIAKTEAQLAAISAAKKLRQPTRNLHEIFAPIADTPITPPAPKTTRKKRPTPGPAIGHTSDGKTLTFPTSLVVGFCPDGSTTLTPGKKHERNTTENREPLEHGSRRQKGPRLH